MKHTDPNLQQELSKLIDRTKLTKVKDRDKNNLEIVKNITRLHSIVVHGVTLYVDIDNKYGERRVNHIYSLDDLTPLFDMCSLDQVYYEIEKLFNAMEE
jgi:hypothetical protein